MTYLPTIHARAARTSAATLTLMLTLAAGADAQGVTTNGNASPNGAAEASAHRSQGAGTGVGGKHDTASRRAAGPKREGDLGRAPFGTGTRRHDASAAGSPSAKPKGDSDGTAGTR